MDVVKKASTKNRSRLPVVILVVCVSILGLTLLVALPTILQARKSRHLNELNDAGLLAAKSGDYDKATRLGEEALALAIAEFPNEGWEVAMAYLNLGSCWKWREEYSKAERYLQEAHVRYMAHGEVKIETRVIPLRSLIGVYECQEQWDKAINASEECLRLLAAGKAADTQTLTEVEDQYRVLVRIATSGEGNGDGGENGDERE